ncbi:hypothetical protein RHEC894_CH02766 [Rhizobium sp. CIAT894]|uniref:hypothetical protein n=1 Tax=Rhizobium sp. CIAT894 TaxID=2020312 RepID=UPI0001909A36|nr:hypothetical protein [Rhizobium sp. CIAT894]ARM89052.1 hypothetical protein RHEC894_CH02766 [Rhizobium sp. CIAT894]
MKATAIKRYRCICEECDPLPPIEGLHPLTHEGDVKVDRTPRELFRIIAKRVKAARRQN